MFSQSTVSNRKTKDNTTFLKTFNGKVSKTGLELWICSTTYWWLTLFVEVDPLPWLHSVSFYWTDTLWKAKRTHLEITTLATPQAELSRWGNCTHLSISIHSCFEVKRIVHNIFAFPNIHIDFRVLEPVFSKTVGKKTKNAIKHLKHPI